MSTTAEIEDIVRQVVGVQDLNGRLWTTADVAAFLCLNPDYVRAHILTRSDFPGGIDLPGKGKEPIRRYRPGDVRDWAEKYRR